MPGDNVSEHGIEYIAHKLQTADIHEESASGLENNRVAWTMLYSGVSPASGKRFGSMP
jgi:hypothetical protein